MSNDFCAHKQNWFRWEKLWAQYEAAIDGKPAVEKYLYPYPAEHDKKYAYRKKMSAWHGLPQSIFERWYQTFKRATINMELPAKKEYEILRTNINGQGGDDAEYRQDVFQELMTYGSVFAHIDEPAWDDKPKDPTRADQTQAKIYPYATLYSQPHIVNWEYNDEGDLVMVTTDTNIMADEDGRVDGEEQKVYPVYREYTMDEITEYAVIKKEKKIIGTAPARNITDASGTERLPWIAGGIIKSKKFPEYWKSPIDGISDKSIELYNRNSQAGALYDKAGFSVLVVGPLTNVTVLGEHSILKLGKDDPAPFYLSPDSTLFDQYRRELERLINEIFGIAGVKNRVTTSQATSSGLALKLEDAATEDKVKMIADATAHFEIQTVYMLADAMGLYNDRGDIVIAYPKSYDIKTMQEELKELETVALTNNKSLYLSSFKEMALRKIQSDDLRQEIIEEEANSTRLNYRALGNIAPDNMQAMMGLGIIDIVRFARELNTDLKDTDDAAVLKWVADNQEKFKRAREEYVPPLEISGGEE